MSDERTQVAIVGAGPAGLLLSRLLDGAGVDAVVLEARSQEYAEARIRAGVLEPGSVEVLHEAGLGERLDREGLRHGGIHLNFDGERHRIPFDELTGGRSITVYGQTEVVTGLEEGLDGADRAPATVRYRHEGAEHTLRAELIAGCDGFHGLCRTTVADRLTTWERSYPYAWLGTSRWPT